MDKRTSLVHGSNFAGVGWRSGFAGSDPAAADWTTDQGRSVCSRIGRGFLVTNQEEGWGSAGSRRTSAGSVGWV